MTAIRSFSVKRLNLGDLTLMNFGDPYGDGRSRVIDFDMEYSRPQSAADIR
jgi:hypothetical protein